MTNQWQQFVQLYREKNPGASLQKAKVSYDKLKKIYEKKGRFSVVDMKVLKGGGGEETEIDKPIDCSELDEEIYNSYNSRATLGEILVKYDSCLKPPLTPTGECEVKVFDCSNEDDKKKIMTYTELMKGQKDFFLMNPLHGCNESDQKQLYFLAIGNTTEGKVVICGGLKVTHYVKKGVYYVDLFGTALKNKGLLGQRIGGKIMEALIKYAKQNGINTIQLDTLPAAVGFYKKYGFQGNNDDILRWLPVKEGVTKPIDLENNGNGKEELVWIGKEQHPNVQKRLAQQKVQNGNSQRGGRKKKDW
jgi:hypothetical protein